MGVALIAVGALTWVLGAFVLRTRLPKAVVAVVLVASGVCVGVGGLVVQSDVTPAEWVLAPAGMGFIGGMHARMLLGPFGKPDPVSGTVSPRKED